jgi:hypothetical protein
MAWDPYTQISGYTGPFLWIFTGTSSGGQGIIKVIDLATKTLIPSVQHNVATELGMGIAGGLDLTTIYQPGTATLYGMIQGASPVNDYVFGYEIATTQDLEPPFTTCTLEGTISGDHYTTPVNVTLSAIDNSSGVNKTYIKIDSLDWKVYTSTEQVTGDGNHTIQYYSTDLAGNIETTKTTTFKIQYPTPIEITIKGGFGITASFKNTGTSKLTGVALSLTLKGGIILIGKKGKTDTQDIDANATATLHLFVLGFGTTTATAKANEVQKIQQMKILLVFVK